MASKRKCIRQDEENPLVALYKRHGRQERDVNLMPVTSEYLRWSKLSKEAKACYNSRLAKLQRKEIAVPKLVSWSLMRGYNLNKTLEKLWEVSTESENGVYEDFSFEYAIRINETQIFREWCLEFFATIHFNQEVKMENIMKEKCIWFRLCGNDHAVTLPEFGQLLGLYDENDFQHEDFEEHLSKLEKEPPKYVGREIWNEIGDPNSRRFKEKEIHSPMARLLHKVIVNSFVHRGHSQDKVHGPDLWIIEIIMDPNKKMNVLWTLAVYLSKRATLITEHGFINGGHYVTKIVKSLGYDTDSELKKITVITECEKLGKKNLKELLDDDRYCLVDQIANVIYNPPPPQQPQQPNIGESSGLNSSWGDWHANLPQVERREMWRDMSLMRLGHQMDYCAPILTYLGEHSEPPYSFPMTYEPIGVPPYPYPYTPYPSGHVPYPTSSTSQRNEGYNVNQEAFAGYYSNVGAHGYEAGTSSGGVGFGALVNYPGDDMEEE